VTRVSARRRVLHLGLAGLALLWLLPLAWAVLTSLRPYAETAADGYVSWPATLTLDNYAAAWTGADLPMFLLNTIGIVVPAVAATLLLASAAAFAIARFSWRWNLAALLAIVAANLLPPQVLVAPVFRLALALPLPAPLSDNGTAYDQAIGVIAVHVAIQLGFCVFVLANFMKTLPRHVTEAALVDGASALQQLWRVVIPMSRAPLAALAVLETTWLYNDFFWGLVLMPSGAKRPVTSALANLQGQFFLDGNLLAAAAVLVAIPPLLVNLVFGRHLLSGLRLVSDPRR
jgi:multiple sugar transport system permease protein